MLISLALRSNGFLIMFLEPAAVALAKKINSDGLMLYQDVAAHTGTAGTTPSALSSTISALAL